MLPFLVVDFSFLKLSSSSNATKDLKEIAQRFLLFSAWRSLIFKEAAEQRPLRRAISIQAEVKGLPKKHAIAQSSARLC
jgi:hypothetical protein